MNDKKEDDSFSTAKTNSSSLNKDNHSSKKEEDDFIHKSKTRGGIKHKINGILNDKKIVIKEVNNQNF